MSTIRISPITTCKGMGAVRFAPDGATYHHRSEDRVVFVDGIGNIVGDVADGPWWWQDNRSAAEIVRTTPRRPVPPPAVEIVIQHRTAALVRALDPTSWADKLLLTMAARGPLHSDRDCHLGGHGCVCSRADLRVRAAEQTS